jgi:AraC-like DNA-binding protein
VDPLADVLDLARVHGALMACVRAAHPWGLELPANGGAAFHAITSGTCWLRVAGRPPLQLGAGDVLLLSTGGAHELASTPDGPTVSFDAETKRTHITDHGELVFEGPGAVTRILCAGYDYDQQVAHPLLSLLPDVLHVAADPVDGARVATVVGMLAGEVGAGEPGARASVARLLDLLLIHVVRRWIVGGDDGRASWLRALRDPALAKVLAAVHAHPDRAWTVETLAGAGHLSRATLARRFVEEVGESPLAYLTRWRMDLAARRLREGDEPIAAIARAVGYRSEYAFNRAFARHRGQPPGRYRRTAAATVIST